MIERRCRHNATEMLEHRRIQRRSGLTIEAYCKREGLSCSGWWYWAKRLESSSPASVPKLSSASPISFLQLPQQQQRPQSRIEVTLPNGTQLAVPIDCPPDFLTRLIRAVSGLRPR